MSLTYGFYDALNHDRTYNASQFSEIFNGIITDGVFASIGDLMAVRALSGMQVTVGSGRAWFNGTWTKIDTEQSLTIPASSLILNRIDAVVLEVDQTNRLNSLKVVQGTAASTPERPTLTDTDYVHQHALAWVYVGAGVSSISASAITNAVGTEDCPLVTAILQTTNITTLLSQWEGQFEDWMDAEEADIQAWYETIQGILDGDPATVLANRIQVLETTVDVEFPVSGWVGSSAPYYQDVSVSYLRSGYRPIIEAYPPDTLTPGTTETDDYFEDCACVTYFVVSNGSLRAYCNNQKPSQKVIFSVKGR